MGSEPREGLSVNHTATAVVQQNLFYGPSTCPGVEEEPFICQKAWSMINGRDPCNSDR